MAFGVNRETLIILVISLTYPDEQLVKLQLLVKMLGGFCWINLCCSHLHPHPRLGIFFIVRFWIGACRSTAIESPELSMLVRNTPLELKGCFQSSYHDDCKREFLFFTNTLTNQVTFPFTSPRVFCCNPYAFYN